MCAKETGTGWSRPSGGGYPAGSCLRPRWSRGLTPAAALVRGVAEGAGRADGIVEHIPGLGAGGVGAGLD